MSRPINPYATLVTQVSESVAKASNEGVAFRPSVAPEGKAKLDATVNRYSGAVGSGFNGATPESIMSSVQNAAGDLVPTAMNGQNAFTAAKGALGKLGTLASDTVGSLTGGNLANGLKSLAGNLKSGAGMLNNFLSMVRGANLPAGAELFSKQGAKIKLDVNGKEDWRVRINAEWKLFNSSLFKPLELTGGFVWPYTPQVTVSTKANYTQIDAVHGIYPFQAYRNSMVDDITITGEFSCETEEDAEYWIAGTTFFKTATKMFFGQGPQAGNPPIVCNLSGYGSSIFNKVPVIIKSFSVDLKDDVNYVQYTPTNTWVPVLSTITVVVAPVYNRARLRQFSLTEYANGSMANSTEPGHI